MTNNIQELKTYSVKVIPERMGARGPPGTDILLVPDPIYNKMLENPIGHIISTGSKAKVSLYMGGVIVTDTYSLIDIYHESQEGLEKILKSAGLEGKLVKA